MKLHRNSQKRYYIGNAIYFITTNTHQGYPYFENDILCELFLNELKICQQIQQFEIHGYKINPEHIHLMVQPSDKYNYSQIMNSLKTNFSRDGNYVLGYNDITSCPKARSRDLAFKLSRDPAFVEHVNLLFKLRQSFVMHNGINHNLPKFKWQSSFYDHIIRDEFDYFNHLKYIQNQWIKHKLKLNKWCWVNGRFI